MDYHFHLALAEASHNIRVIYQLKLLVTECRYLFFVYPHRSHTDSIQSRAEEAMVYLRSIQADHCKLLELVKAGASEEAERKARGDMRKSAERLVRLMITGNLPFETS